MPIDFEISFFFFLDLLHSPSPPLHFVVQTPLFLFILDDYYDDGYDGSSSFSCYSSSDPTTPFPLQP